VHDQIDPELVDLRAPVSVKLAWFNHRRFGNPIAGSARGQLTLSGQCSKPMRA